MMADEKRVGITLDKNVNVANIISILGSFAIVIAFVVSLNTRVEFLECQVKENNNLTTKVVRLETKMDSLSENIQEIKGDLKTALGRHE